MTEIFGILRRAVTPGRKGGPSVATPPVSARRQHNLFEAAAVFVAASAEDDEERMDEASGWVSPEQLSFGVSELACRALIALARERDQPPQAVARELLGLTSG